MGYKSRIDIKIGRIPESPDESFYPIFQEIYNALHLINANLDATVDIITPPESDKDPSESFAPRFNSFWAAANENCTQGRVVRQDGAKFVRGAVGLTYQTADGDKRVTDPFGIVIEDPVEDKARIAWPPFVLELESSDTDVGEIIYTDNTGKLFFLDEVKSKHWPVGRLLAKDTALFIPGMHT